jgi:MSHA type pilus biogenesis protein MshL
MAVVFVAQTGCAPVRAPGREVSPPPQAVPGRAEKVSEEKLPGLIITEIETKREPERLYGFSLRDADIREVFMAISKHANFNVVADPDVQGKVTVDLKNVTLTEALDTLSDLLDLTYAVKQNVIRVSKPKPETRVFALQYVNLKRSGTSSTSAQVGAAGGRAGGQSTVTTTTETDLWKDIDAGVAKLLSPTGKMLVDRQSGNIVVTDFPRFLDQIGDFLEKIEGSVQRQVLIEARIIEVTLTGEYRFGLDWGAIARAGALRGATGVSPNRIIGQKLAPSESTFQVGVTNTDFAALLSVLSKQGEINVLSSPKLATLNNQTAVIRSATDEVFFERRSVTTTVAGALQQTTEVTPRTITVGVVLAVTPQIAADGNVVLHVRPTVTEKSRDVTFEEAGSAGVTKFTAPVLDVREADMIVRAREGQVVVIGGLMQEKKSDDESKVPILGDLPGVGRLFRATTQQRKKTELVVLLSPTVLVGKKVDEVTSREMERLKKLKGRSPW